MKDFIWDLFLESLAFWMIRETPSSWHRSFIVVVLPIPGGPESKRHQLLSLLLIFPSL